jgi:catalase
MEQTPAASPAKVTARDMPPSPAVGLLGKAKATIEGRDIACLVTDGVDRTLVDSLRKAVEAEGAKLTIIAPKVGGVRCDGKKTLGADAALAGAPSVLFDAVVLAFGPGGGEVLAKEAAAIDFVRDAFGHLKIIGFTEQAQPLLDAAGLAGKADGGVLGVGTKGGVAAFISAAKQHRIWVREPSVRSSP